jgi:hypothetical protein
MNTTRSPCRARRSSFCTTVFWAGVQYDAAAHRPEVDDVADQIGLFGRVFAQEVEQTVGLARPRAEVDVGEKN